MFNWIYGAQLINILSYLLALFSNIVDPEFEHSIARKHNIDELYSKKIEIYLREGDVPREKNGEK